MVEEVRPAYADDEIDLVELMQTIWDGKWLVAAFAAVAVALGGAFAFLKPAVFEATTEIKPITSSEAQLYRANNALGFFEVSPGTLRSLFIEYLDERTLFEAAIRKHALLNRADFASDEDYDIAVVELAAAIAIQPPINEDGAEKGESRRHWTIVFEGTDKEKWLAALADVTANSTAKVRETLVERFNTAVEVAQQSRAFKLEDLATQMENAKADFEKEMQEFELVQGFEMEDVRTQILNAQADFDLEMEKFEMERSFELEDVSQKIQNALVDYDRKTRDRLAFLKEQAAIARKLGVAKNTLEAQTFAASTGVVANVKSDTPFYLRGYEAIEKEIELISSREDKVSFVGGLLELEQKQRELEQDRTIQRAERKKAFLDSMIELEKRKRLLEQDKTLERADRKEAYLTSVLEIEGQQRAIQQDKTIDRAKALFASTPVNDAQQFVAAQYDVFATNIESKSKRSLIVALALVLGGMVGVMFVLIRSAMRKRKPTA